MTRFLPSTHSHPRRQPRWDGKAPSTIGELQAWDLKTGKQVWTHKFPTHLWAPLLTTGGNLLFAGGTNDRMFRAFDATNGKVRGRLRHRRA